MANDRVGGIIKFFVDGAIQQAKGEFTINDGSPKREAIMGVDGYHGHKAEPQPAMIQGSITVGPDTDIKAIKAITDAQIQIDLANGQTYVQPNSAYTGEGNYTTGEGELGVEFKARKGEYI